VLTIEPIIAAGSGAVSEAGDGWTMRTSDGTLSAHAEHTMVITAASRSSSRRLIAPVQASSAATSRRSDFEAAVDADH